MSIGASSRPITRRFLSPIQKHTRAEKSRGFADSFNVHVLPGQIDGLTAEGSNGMIGSGGNVGGGGLVAASLTGAATLEPDLAAPVTATESAASVIACVEPAAFCSLGSCRRIDDFLAATSLLPSSSLRRLEPCVAPPPKWRRPRSWQRRHRPSFAAHNDTLFPSTFFTTTPAGARCPTFRLPRRGRADL